MINERIKYTANTGMGIISTANSNLDGTGTTVGIITAASNGTLIKKITIKAITNTTRGMVRLFTADHGTSLLLMEVEVPAVTKSGTDESFVKMLDVNFRLSTGIVLRASTENAESFQVIAEGLNWTY